MLTGTNVRETMGRLLAAGNMAEVFEWGEEGRQGFGTPGEALRSG